MANYVRTEEHKERMRLALANPITKQKRSISQLGNQKAVTRVDLRENIDKIINLYKGGKTASELGKMFNTTHNTILFLLRKNNIEIRPQKLYVSGKKNVNYKEVPKQELIRYYQDKSYISDLAKNYKCSASKIRSVLKLNNIKIVRMPPKIETIKKVSKTRIERGVARLEKNPAWLGGKSFEPYSPEFNKEFKNIVRLRDNFCCLNCGLSEQKQVVLIGKKLTVHHMDYNKKNTCLINCCTLCSRCNVLANKNRDAWIEYYRGKLNKLYGYDYVSSLNSNEVITQCQQ